MDTIPLWVILCGARRDRAGHDGRRLAHRADDGPAHHASCRPYGGFCAETGGATSIFIASHFGIPVSTTHTITGAISGVGAAQRISSVRWGVAGRIVWAWILTIPLAAVIAALSYLAIKAVAP